MPKVYKIRKGLNIPLKGEAEKVFTRTEQAEAYAIKPIDFPGITPKLSVREGDKVLTGSSLFLRQTPSRSPFYIACERYS